jgi:hypothetical protein
MLSDTFKIEEVDGVLLQCDCKKFLKGSENFELEGANPSAEAGDDDGGDAEGVQTMVHDIEDQFRLVWLKQEEGMKPSKDAFKGHLKSKYAFSLLSEFRECSSLTFVFSIISLRQGCQQQA